VWVERKIMIDIVDIIKTIWRYKVIVLCAFVVLFGADLVLGGLKTLIFQCFMFVLGVVIGHRHPKIVTLSNQSVRVTEAFGTRHG
jgi:hypothetical protein